MVQYETLWITQGELECHTTLDFTLVAQCGDESNDDNGIGATDWELFVNPSS